MTSKVVIFDTYTRMPVILHSRDYDRWLSREVTEQLPLDLLRPYESEDMEMVEGGPPVPNTGRTGPMAFHAG
jgi:putative SOS response-associated peptidase YedK